MKGKAVKALIFSNECGEWYISWANPYEPISGPYKTLDEAIEEFQGEYPDIQGGYEVSKYSEQMEWAG